VVDPAQKGNVMTAAGIRIWFWIPAVILALASAEDAQSREYFLTGTLTQKYAVILGGAAADERYRDQFRQWTQKLHEILVRDYGYPPDHITLLLGRGDPAVSNIAGPCRQETVLEAMGKLRQKVRPGDQISVFFIGHGTSDDQAAKFVMKGPDLTAVRFAEILAGFSDQDIAVVNATASSHPFCAALAAPGRVIVCATRSAAERYDTVFAQFLLQALERHNADRDKNRRVSLFEIFLYVREKVKEWYSEQDRLPSEHPTLDDTGDGHLITDPDPIRGEGRLAQIAEIDSLGAILPNAVASGPDAEALRELTARVHGLERSVILLRTQKAEMSQEDYRDQLETLLIDLARSTRRLDVLQARLKSEYP
jgi:hypothetical protein